MTVVRPLLAAVVCSAVAFAQQTPPQSQSEESQPPATHGKVLFSRSADDAKTDDAKQSDAQPEKSQAAVAKVSDAERSALVFTAYDLDVHLMLQQQAIAVMAHVTVRNDSDQPLAHLPIQLSSSLKFESISSAGQKLPFAQQIINSDADHTGQLRDRKSVV